MENALAGFATQVTINNHANKNSLHIQFSLAISNQN
jgi:hypothetical protein